ncbi:MAG: flagellar motor switch protein FliM [Deferribacterota bacterium]|nr:flagellar motor switch protein FliM [Deferribacterota bacterium]
MAEILSQEEIDELLSAVAEEGVEEKKYEELDFVPKKVSAYDFRRPDRVSKEQLRSIRSLHDKFARNFSSSLSSFLRTIIDINLISIDQMTYGEFLLSLPDPTSFNILSMVPLEGNIVLEINPSLVYPIIDKLLGGSGEPLYKIRELTGLEQDIINNLISIIMKDLQDVWKQIVPNIKFRKEVSENSPQIVQIVAQNEVVVLVVFDVKLGEASGMINICYPTITIEPLLPKLSSQDWLIGAKRFKQGVFGDKVLKLLEDAKVSLKVNMGKTILPIKDVMGLTKDDVIVFDKKVDEPFELYVENVYKYTCELGKSGTKKAVKIKDILPSKYDIKIGREKENE